MEKHSLYNCFKQLHISWEIPLAIYIKTRGTQTKTNASDNKDMWFMSSMRGRNVSYQQVLQRSQVFYIFTLWNVSNIL